MVRRIILFVGAGLLLIVATEATDIPDTWSPTSLAADNQSLIQNANSEMPGAANNLYYISGPSTYFDKSGTEHVWIWLKGKGIYSDRSFSAMYKIMPDASWGCSGGGYSSTRKPIEDRYATRALTTNDAGKLACFRVRMLGSYPNPHPYNYYQTVISSDVGRIRVGLTTQGQRIRASVYGGGSDAISTDYKISTNNSCNSSGTFSPATDGTGSYYFSRDLTSSDSGKYACFRAKRGNGSYRYSISYRIYPITITVDINNASNQATASISGGPPTGATSVYSAIKTDSSCSASTSGLNHIRKSPYVVNLFAADNNKYICYKVIRGTSYDYDSALIAVTGADPRITITQDQDSVDATAITQKTSVITSSWAHTNPSVTDIACPSAIYNSAGSSEKTVSISSSDNNKYVCFRVKANNHIYAYKKWKVDYNPPTVAITQTGDSLQPSTPATDIPANPIWQYSVHATDPTCSSITTGWLVGSKVKYISFSRYYCFRVTDNAGNIGYGEIKPTIPNPELVVRQNQTSISAIASSPHTLSWAGTGFSAGVSLDNDRLAVGANNCDCVFIFKRTGITWSLERKIEAGSSDGFGYIVSLDGDRLAVGAPYDDGQNNITPDSGAVYIFKRTGTTWVLERKIDNGFTALGSNDRFGHDVSLDGNRLAVGAKEDDGKDDKTSNAGAVYIFKRTAATWALERKIEDGSDGFTALDANDVFGRHGSVSLDGDRLAVGAREDDGKNGSTTNAGAVYIFKRTGTNWALERKIEDGSDGFNHLDASDAFGYGVSLDGDRLAVGARADDGKNNHSPASGAVYIFKRTGTNWALERKIEDGSDGFNHLDASDAFGYGVSLDGDRLAVGAWADGGKNNSTTNAGAVYIFKRTAATWALDRKIEDESDGFTALDPSDSFGSAYISLDGNQLAVGAYNDDGHDNGASNAGAVYMFDRSETTWTDTEKFRKHEGLVANSWQNFKTTNSTEPNCDPTNTFGSASSSADSIAITSSDNNKWVCFRVKNSDNIYFYVKEQIDYDSPTITITQTNDSLQASATATDLPDNPVWQYSVHSTDPTCSSVTSGWINGSKAKYISFSKYYCFRAIDNAGNYGYGKIKPTIPNPELVVRQNQTSISAIASSPYTLSLDNNDELAAVSVSLDGDRLAVGAWEDDGKNNGTTNAGAVYIFKRTATTWALERKIEDGSDGFTALDGGDAFGSSVSLDGDQLAVGANQDEGKSNGTTDAGAVYIFQRTGTTWALERKIEDESDGFTALDAEDAFGSSVSLDGDHLAVGAHYDRGKNNNTTNAGAVYIFKRTGTTWTLERKIEDGSGGFTALDSLDYFGESVSLDGDRLAVGAHYDDGKNNQTSNSGAVYIFKRTGTTWALEKKIQNSSPVSLENDDEFGRSVSLDSDRLAVGAYGDDGKNNGTLGAGAVYIFKRTGTTWALEMKIDDGSDGFSHLDSNDQFGGSVSIDGDRLAVGAHGDDGKNDSTTDAGAVYIFKRTGTTWSLEKKIEDGSDEFRSLDSNDRFGHYRSVSLDGNQLAVGAHNDDGHDNGASNAGAVYMFDRSETTWTDTEKFQKHEGLVANSWQNFQTTNSTTPACNSTDLSKFGTASNTADSIIITSSDNNKWVCFRVKNANNTYFYVKKQIDYNSPAVTITQTGDNLQATTTATDLPDNPGWQYSEHTTDPTCNTITTGWVKGSEAKYIAFDKYYCFRVTDMNINTGYGEIKPTIPGPGLIVQQTQTDIKAIATSVYALDIGSNDRFGDNVSLDGDRLAVGSHTGDGSLYSNGAVYIFKRTATTWALEKKIENGSTNFGSSGDGFGRSISLDGDRLAIGAPGDDGNFDNTAGSGAVYIFKRTGATWSLERGIQEDAWGFTNLERNDWFGESVSLDGDRLAIGAPGDDGKNNSTTFAGAVYIFKRTGTTWAVERKIEDGSNGFTALGASDYFGWRGVSLKGNRLAVGAHGDDGKNDSTTNAGAVYIFKRTGTTWSLERKIEDGSDGFTALDSSDGFGWEVSLDNDRLAVGANGDDGKNNGTNKAGAVYIFKRTATTWSLERKIEDESDGFTALGSSDNFGLDVSLDGDRLAVGAYYDDGKSDSTTNAGAVYIFKRTGTTWSLERKIEDGSDGFTALDSSDKFGGGVSLDGNQLVVGANGDDEFSGSNTGASYIFERANGVWTDKEKFKSNPGLVDSSWQNFKTTNTTAPACTSADLSKFGTASKTASSVTISSLDNNKWVCFRVKNSDNVYFYVKRRIDFNAPAITITQTNDSLQATAIATDIPDNAVWQYSEHTTNPTCSSVSSGWINGSKAKYIAFEKYYCFKITDTSNNTGYAKIKPTIPNPQLTVKQTQTKIKAEATSPYSLYSSSAVRGFSRVSLDGNRLAVGAPSGGRGFVYILKQSLTNWAVEQVLGGPTLTSLDGGDGFGTTVSLDGDRLAVGAPYDDGSQNSTSNAGAVYIFKRTGSTWGLEQRIYKDQSNSININANDLFGGNVALDGDRLAVGSTGRESYDGAKIIDAGAVFIFKRTKTTWSLERLIWHSNSKFNFLGPRDYFGSSISLNGDRLAIGSINNNRYGGGTKAGAVYIFKRTSTTWNLEQRLVSLTGFDASDQFGTSVSLDGDRLAVGAPQDDGKNNSTSNAGAVYIFKRTNVTWDLERKIENESGGFAALNENDKFGDSVSLAGNRLAVGSSYDDGNDNNTSDAGAVYVFRRTGTTWALERKIEDGSDGFNSLNANDRFGANIALDASRLAVGANTAAGYIGSNAGAVYIFERPDINWEDTVKFRSNPGLVASSWQNFKTTTTTAPACTSADLSKFGTASASANSVTISSSDNNKWACFRVKDVNNVYFYVKKQIDFNSPAVTITQTKDSLQATTTATDIPDNAVWQYKEQTTNPTCKNLASGWVDGSKARYISLSKYYCFRIKDNSGNYGYGKIKPTIPDPGLVVRQTQTSISATATSTFSLPIDAGDKLGTQVSMGADRLAVGNFYYDGRNNGTTDSGAVYIFKRTGTTWVLEQKIEDGSDGFTALDASDYFGSSVSLDGDRLAVGASGDDGKNNGTNQAGAVYIFKRTETTWSLERKIEDGSDGFTALDADDRFGHEDVSLDGDRLAVGARKDDGKNNQTSNAGAVYIFKRTGTTWSLERKIEDGSDGFTSLGANDEFGSSVSLDGDRLAVGAFWDDGKSNNATNAGAVYIFKRTGTTWSLERKIEDGADGFNLDNRDYFGAEVSLDGNHLAVGAYFDDGKNNGTTNAGAVYIFKRTWTTWSLERKIEDGSDGFTALDVSDWFSHQISLDGNRLAIGAYGDDGKDNSTSNAGAVYIFKRTGTTWDLERKIEDGSDGFTALDANDEFGLGVSLSGDQLAVGAWKDDGHDNGASDAGAVYMFERSGTTWADTDKFQEHEGLVANSWQNFKTADSTAPVCTSADDSKFGTASNTGDVMTITSSDNNKWVCFRAKNTDNIYFYIKEQLDFNPPAVTITQTGDSLQASTTATDLPSQPVWQYRESTTNPTCSNLNSGWINSSKAKYISFSKYYCFRVADKAGNNGYSKIKPTIPDPGLVIKQTLTGISAIATSTFALPINTVDTFGARVSLDGDRLAVGATGDNSDRLNNNQTSSGAVYIFKRTATTWALETKIADALNGFSNDAYDHLGSSVSLNGDRLAVGAYKDDGKSNSTTNAGAVYIFKRTGTTWALERKIEDGSDGFMALDASDYFGRSVSLDGERLAVGAANDDGKNNGTNQAGAVYIFKRTGTTWALERKIEDGSDGFTAPDAYDGLGRSVSLDGDRLAVGATGDDGKSNSSINTGSVYIFKRAGTTWTLERKIEDGSDGFTALDDSDAFGYSISLDGDRLAVGAHEDDGKNNSATHSGAVYIFKRTATTWSLERKIEDGSDGFTAPDAYDDFGFSVSLDGDRLAVGANYDDGKNNATRNAGAVYIFKRAGTTWTLERKIEDGSDGFYALDGDLFGWSVSLDGDRLASGAIYDRGHDNNSIQAGATYIFQRIRTGWEDTDKLQKHLGLVAGSWQNFKTTNTTAPACSSADSSKFGTAGVSAYSITITSSDNNKWVCFRVKNANNVYFYVKKQIDYNPPAVAITQTGDSLQATTTATDLPDNPVWEYRESTTDPTCSNLNSGWINGSKAKYISFSKYYCFRVADNAGNNGYSKIKPTIPDPGLVIKQTQTKISASATSTYALSINANDEFGHSVSLDGDRLAVGAWYDDGKNNSTSNAGAVYIFKRTGTTWALERKIEDGSDGFNHLDVDDRFGLSVSLDGDWLAVGAYRDSGKNNSTFHAGAVYIFKRTGATWSLERKIEDGSDGFNNLDADDWFGFSVSLDGDRLAVGANKDDGKNNGTYNAGAVYIFKRTGTTWSLERKIEDRSDGFNDLVVRDNFGDSVSLDGDRLAVGALNDDGKNNGTHNAGAVYIFKRTGTTWALERKIEDGSDGFNDLDASDNFGGRVSLDGDRLAVGAVHDDGKNNRTTSAGAVYIFKRTGTTWGLERKIEDGSDGFNDLDFGDYFGWRISLDGDRLAVGAVHDDGKNNGTSKAGAVYIFKRTGTTWALERED